MKNFNLIEMAKAMKEHKLRHMWRYAAMLFAVLVMSMANVGTAWGQTSWVRLDSIDLTNTTNFPAVTYTGQSATVHGVFFRAKSSKNVKVNNTTPGVDFDGTNVNSSGDHCIAIPVTGVNGSLKVIVYHDYNNTSAKHNVGISHATGNDPSVSQTWDQTPSNSGTQNKNDFVMTKSSLTGTAYIVWVGESSSSYKVIKRVAIYTEAPSCDAADLTASNITSNGDQEAGTGITFSKVGSPASGDTWYWQTSAAGTDKTYNATSPYTTATTAGSYTVYLRAYNTAGNCWGTAASMTNTIYPAPSAMIHNTFAVNAAWGSTIATQDKTNITGLNAMAAVGESVGSGSNKSGLTQKIPSQSSEDAGKYMSLSFNVASGKQLNVTSVVFDEQPVNSTGTFKVSISDNQGSATKTQTIAGGTAGSKHTLTLDGDIVGSFKGTVTVKVWAYGWSDGYRFGDYFYINGTVTAAASTPRTFKSGDKIYFKDKYSSALSSTWKTAGGYLYAYFFNATEENWSDKGTLVAGTENNADAVYQFTVPGSGKTYTTVIFTRGTAATFVSGDGFWNKVADQTPAVGKNLFTVSTSAYDGEWGQYGYPAALVGSFNNWDPSANVFPNSGISSVNIDDLEASTSYQFKVLQGESFCGVGSGTITGTTTDWWHLDGAYNVYMTTGTTGRYTFSWNTSTYYLGVYYPGGTLTKNKYIYFDARTETDWVKAGFAAQFVFKFVDSGSEQSTKWCEKGDAVQDWVYYTTVPDNDFIGQVKMDRYSAKNGTWWNRSAVTYAYSRDNINQNCMVTPSSGGDDIALTWGTYCPPISTSTLSDNSTSVISWSSGDGTSGDPFLVPADGTIKVSASATKAVPDPDMTINYDFKVDGSSAQSGTGSTFDKGSLSNNTTYTISLDTWNSFNSTTGTKNTSATALYYKALTMYSVTHSLTGVTRSDGRDGSGAAAYYQPYTATYAASTGYNLPTTITVKFGSTTKTAGTDYTWNQATGIVSIPAGKINDNVTIIIDGVAKTTAITLEAGEGGTDGSATATYGTSTITDYVPATRTGYTLGNYYKDAGDHNILTDAGALNSGDKGTLIKGGKWASEDAAVTLYAQWSATSYTLSYDLAGGNVASPNPTSYTIESSDITLNNPTKTGYTFAGWTGTGLAEATTTVTIAAGSTGDRSYTATWTAIVPSSVTLNKTSTTITVGGTETLTATISPVVVADNTITWTSSDETVATVTSAGVVTGVKAGTATITATTVNGKAATCAVTVAPAVTYTVTYDYQGATSGASPASATGASVSLPNPTKEGYTLQGWYTSSGALAGAATATYNPTSDITLYALWREDACAGGGGGSTTLISYTITAECKGDDPCELTASGTPGGTAYLYKLASSDGKYKLNNDYAYFALRLSSGYFQTGDVLTMDGSKAMEVYTGTHGSGTRLAATSEPSDGVISYTLPNTLPNNTSEIYVYRSSSTYNGKLTYMTVTRSGGSGTCYYVTYNGNGADGGFTKDEASHPSGSDVTVKTNSFTKTGYTFTGWKTEPSGGTSYTAGGTISGISGNMTLYAQWAQARIITADVNDGEYGSVSPASITVADGSTISISDNVLTCDGKTLTATATTSTTEYTYAFNNWTGVTDGGTVSSNLTATANFTRTTNTYDLTWDLAGGTTTSEGTGIGSGVSSNTTTSQAFGTALTAPTVTKTGYTFSAWSPTVASTMPAANTTYTATWTAKTTTVTINANTSNHGSTAPSPITATYGSALPSFTPAAGVSGWNLTGYFTEATSGTKVINANGTLVASTDYADGSGNWKYETATLTLYPQYEEEGCTPQSLSKVVLSASGSSVIGTATGYNNSQYTGTPEVKADYDKTDATNIDGKDGDETGYKMGSGGNSIVFAMLKGTSFQAGDKVRIGITRRNDTRQVDSKYNILTIYYGTSKSDAAALTTITTGGDNDNSASAHEGAGFYEYTLSAEDVTTIGSKKGIGLFRESSYGENPYVYSVEIIGCREWAVCMAPGAVAAGSVTATGATFTITDAENTNNYEIYYSTSSTAPTAETSATVSGISSKSRAVTGLTASTTYYYWVRSNCGGATKSSWVAGTPASFTTSAAAATYSVTYDGNEKTGGSVPTDDNDYEEGDVVTVLGNTGSLVKTGYSFVGWNTASDGTGTFYPAGYKFYMGDANVTLYAVWGSTGAECITIAYFETNTHAKVNNKPDASSLYLYGYTNSAKTSAYAYTLTTSSTNNKGQGTGASDYLRMDYGTTVKIYANNTTTEGTPTSFEDVTSVSVDFKMKNSSYYTSFDIYVGDTKIADNVSLQGDAQTAFKTYSYSDLSNLDGAVRIVNKGSGSSNYHFYVDNIQICYGSGAASGFTVSFDMNDHGSAIADIENVPSGSKISAPVPAPTATGYEFGGWYREAGCTNAWNFGSSTISKDTTLYAKWTTCAPSISAHPAAATYTQGAAATALSVTASGDGLNYQWYTSEDGSADISGSSAIPGATSESYTPSTSLLGTIYYFCVVSNTCGNAVSNKAAITVNDSKPAPTANWTGTEDSPKSGGKGWTVTVAAKKNDGSTLWDGDITTSMLTASAGVTLSGLTANNSAKTITGTYSLPAGVESPITFTLTLPATGTQAAASLDHNVSFTPCAGGVGSSYDIRVRKNVTKGGNYYYNDNADGWISPKIASSHSNEESGTKMGDTDKFDTIYNTNTQYVWVRTYHANIKKVRIYAQFRSEGMTVSQVYKHTDFFSADDKYIVSYSEKYNDDPDATGTGEANAFEYVDITLTEAMDANDILLVKFNDNRVRPLGAILYATGDSGDQTTGLTWSNDQASGATVEKREDDADFTITAVRDATALKSLGLISYTSSNTAIATVNASTGLVHIADNIDFGSDEYKTTTITATLAASGCYQKKVITYILKVTKHECEDAPGTITYVDHGCSMDLTLEGYEEGATIQWYKGGSPVGTNSATYNATEPGEYYAVTHKTCDITSTNSVTLETATATAEKIVDQWYVKNGRRTPDIALVQTTGATSFTVTSGGTITEIGGCTFELKEDGIIYLHGQKEDGSAPSDMTAGDMTITITVSGCAGALSGLDITIHKQAETAKPSVAFVVDGTTRAKGGTATSVSEDKTINRDLWKYLNNTFTLTGCNAYWSVDSKELRQYYSQFDAILITDDPSTDTKGTGGVSYVKAFGTMVDVRPVLTMEAFVGKFKDGGWHVYDATPTSPNPRQVEMKLECKNHDIFKGLDPETSDNVRTTTDEHGNEYWHVIMVDTTVAPYHNTSKDYKALPALQGFDKKKFSNMLGVGTIAEETLQGGVERQEEPAARMMILGIQNEAMAALTNEGKLIVKNAIEYLLKTNMEDVNDCSNYFTGGPSGTGDNWATPENWSSGKVPDFESRVRILRPVVISGDTKAIVARVDIATSGKSKWRDGECNGSVTVNPRGALIVSGKIRRAEAPRFGIDDLMPTENDDLIVKAEARPEEPHKQGALIFDNSDGDTHAVVEMWNPSYWEVVDGKKKKYWSYVAVPIQEADIPNFFWHGFTYLYDETSGWIKKGDGTSLYPFQGIGASLQDGNMETFYGPLATTESQDITLTYTADKGQGMNLIGNSWTAPIQIANFEEDDFGDAAAEVWVFNTGNTNDGYGDGTTTTAGQWNAIPINAPSLPGYEGLKVIPAMQAFEVNTESETTLHLDYDRLVRAGRENLNEPMRAPRRSAAKQIEATMRVRVSGESTHTDVYLLKDARFSDGFDNGWDGHFLSGDDRSAQLYAISEEEGKLAFLAQPEIEGTQLGFAPSKHGNEYTFSFSYDGDEEYYLNDIKLQQSTQIDAENKYLFTYEEGDANRFFISRQPLGVPEVATGNDAVKEDIKAVKIIYNDKLYIIRAGRVYSAEGILVK